MSTSLIYRTSAGYELVMLVLYGRHYSDRLRAVAAQVPSGSSVLELCCGPGTLYLRHLRSVASSYVGIDVNGRFVERLRHRGAQAQRIDLAYDSRALPRADVTIMQASLYHFMPDPERIVERMLSSARERVIISEPVRNLSSSRVPIHARLGKGASDPGVGGHGSRFTEATLDRLMARYHERVILSGLIPGGREKLYVLAGRDR